MKAHFALRKDMICRLRVSKKLMMMLFAIAFLCPGISQQRNLKSRSRNNGGFYYIRAANPQKISHYMREAGLTYLDAVESSRKATLAWSMAKSHSEDLKQTMDANDQELDTAQSHLKINYQAPGDKDFVSVLIYTRSVADVLSTGTGLCARGLKPQEVCDQKMAAYVVCKNWMRDAIESGVLADNWHEGCYGNWDEVHKQNDQ